MRRRTPARTWGFRLALAFLLPGLSGLPATGATEEAAAPAGKTGGGVQGKVVAAGQPVAGATVHAFADASAGFRGEGTVSSAPSAADGSFSLELSQGSWYLVVKGPASSPGTDPGGEGALFGYYGGNPVVIGAASRASANLQVVRRRLPVVTQSPSPGKTLLGGVVLGPDGPVPGANVHVYTDASRQFRGPDLFGPQGAVVGGVGGKGEFTVELPPGSYFLVATKRKAGDVLGPLQPGDLHGWYDGNPVEIAPGTLTAVAIQTVAKIRDAGLATAAAAGAAGIRGTLRDAAGKAPVGAYAYATTDPSFMIGAMPPFRSPLVGPDGTFFIEVLSGGGTFYVGARSGYGGPPLPGEWYGFHGDSTPAPVVVEGNRVTEGIAIVLKRME